jgi:hypothetical protein
MNPYVLIAAFLAGLFTGWEIEGWHMGVTQEKAVVHGQRTSIAL